MARKENRSTIIMFPEDLEQKPPSARALYHRRMQRYIICAFAFILFTATIGVYRYRSWQPLTQLQLDTLEGLHIYGSTPEAGKPSLPFDDYPDPRSEDTDWFDTAYRDERGI